MTRVAVIGAGAFGTALAVAQAAEGRRVLLWGRDPERMRDLQAGRENKARLPGVRLPDGVDCVTELRALARAEVMLLSLPAQSTGTFLRSHAAELPPVPLVLCAKGIESGALRLQSEIVTEAMPGARVAVLTGPGFATEISRGLPTALTLAAGDLALGQLLLEQLATRRLRLYLSEDMPGAQLGGAFKNVIAIACGMVEGGGLGQSARAALMTRGFAEMTRLAVAMGAKAETLTGLSGLGDLALTCNSTQSRNFALGIALGGGVEPAGGTVEGVATARAACQLGARHGVELPIAMAVANVVEGLWTMTEAIEALLSRPLKEE